ncbi:MAG TPA: hypothetical protein VGK54_02940 [Chloroflexota bacterium]
MKPVLRVFAREHLRNLVVAVALGLLVLLLLGAPLMASQQYGRLGQGRVPARGDLLSFAGLYLLAWLGLTGLALLVLALLWDTVREIGKSHGVPSFVLIGMLVAAVAAAVALLMVAGGLIVAALSAGLIFVFIESTFRVGRPSCDLPPRSVHQGLLGHF